MTDWATRPGETPIDDVSGLIARGVKSRQELNVAEADNIREVIIKYLAAKPSRDLAPDRSRTPEAGRGSAILGIELARSPRTSRASALSSGLHSPIR